MQRMSRRPWVRYLYVAWLAWIAFILISDVISEPSTWDWIQLALGGIAIPWLAYSQLRPERPSVEKIGPESVPAEDVETVVAESGRTVHTIKALREMHPGLGLLDAKNLVQPDC
ncbi:hypothetical protein CH251_01290 [Rhodococcus sp. 06-462-5]|nr:hypothetical protein CH251_01290 [Rhodococcus sp. 06-462-5]OZE60099.1 hypothetical protein CH270_23230 [Rhodococcus sp. 02-925g]